MKNIKELDIVSKAILVIFIVIIFYLLSFLILRPFFVQEPQTMYEMMQQMMGSSDQTTILNAFAIALALGIGLIVSLYMRTLSSKEYELKVIRKALSKDEKRVLDEIKKAGEITQDSLRFRLNWSKAKVSRILLNLDKMNLIQRKRVGKTYNVFLEKKR